jgi:hypothetical protein
MLDYLPFLIGAKAYGVIALLTFISSTVIIPIPVFASRGRTQLAWFGLAGFLITIEAAALITLGFLVSNGTIWK